MGHNPFKNPDRNVAGVLIAGTPVCLANGQARPIEALASGDLLRGASGRPVEVLELIEAGRGHRVLEIGLSDGSELVVTPQLPLIVARPGRLAVLPAAELVARDGVAVRRDDALRRAMVAVVRPRLWGGAAYSLRLYGGMVQSEHLFLAGDLAVGDLFLQEWIAARSDGAGLRKVG